MLIQTAVKIVEVYSVNYVPKNLITNLGKNHLSLKFLRKSKSSPKHEKNTHTALNKNKFGEKKFFLSNSEIYDLLPRNPHTILNLL